MNEQKVGSLTQQTEQELRRRITEGPIRVGEKLPTEKALAVEFGVSRTVVREAVAALRADGLLEARHGVGVFVANPKNDPSASSASVLDTLELRMAVEVHAAGLAAARRSWAQDEKIWASAKAFSDALETGQPTETADWTFHRSISEASNNVAFVEFFDNLGLRILPRRLLAVGGRTPLINRTYLSKSVDEHRAVCEAISLGDVDGARQAMQNHLGSSQLRYRGLAQIDADGSLSSDFRDNPVDETAP